MFVTRMALAKGALTATALTSSTLTVVWACKKFLDPFRNGNAHAEQHHNKPASDNPMLARTDGPGFFIQASLGKKPTAPEQENKTISAHR